MKDEGAAILELSYVIRFVADMDATVSYHRDVLGMAATMVTPFWSEFGAGTSGWHCIPPRRNGPWDRSSWGFVARIWATSMPGAISSACISSRRHQCSTAPCSQPSPTARATNAAWPRSAASLPIPYFEDMA